MTKSLTLYWTGEHIWSFQWISKIAPHDSLLGLFHLRYSLFPLFCLAEYIVTGTILVLSRFQVGTLKTQNDVNKLLATAWSECRPWTSTSPIVFSFICCLTSQTLLYFTALFNCIFSVVFAFSLSFLFHIIDKIVILFVLISGSVFMQTT